MGAVIWSINGVVVGPVGQGMGEGVTCLGGIWCLVIQNRYHKFEYHEPRDYRLHCTVGVLCRLYLGIFCWVRTCVPRPTSVCTYFVGGCYGCVSARRLRGVWVYSDASITFTE